MLVSKLDHINLSVHCFDETVNWYNKIFGFNLVEEGIENGVKWGVIRSNDAMLCIYEVNELVQLDRFEMKDKGLHYLAHFGLRITNKQSWEEIIKKEKLGILYNGVIKWPHSLAWYIKDPTGWEIEIVYWGNDTIQF
jgi:catechol-2,3-dioxygenase